MFFLSKIIFSETLKPVFPKVLYLMIILIYLCNQFDDSKLFKR